MAEANLGYLRVLKREKCVYARAVQLTVDKLDVLNVAAFRQDSRQHTTCREIELRAEYSQLRDGFGHLDLQLEARKTGHFKLIQCPDVQIRKLFRYLFVKLQWPPRRVRVEVALIQSVGV